MPEPLYAALASSRFDYDPELIHVTELIAPVQQTVLSRRHWDHIVEDASDRLWALMGTAAHMVAELWDKPGVLKEHNIVTEEIAGLRVTGTIDALDTNDDAEADIYDYKMTSCWTIIKQNRMEDYERQVNLYAALARREGHLVRKAMILYFLRDHSAAQAWKTDGYPDIPAAWDYVNIWDAAIAEDYLQDRVRVVADALQHPGDLPLCSRNDRWNRAGADVRCRKYCNARPFCKQKGITAPESAFVATAAACETTTQRSTNGKSSSVRSSTESGASGSGEWLADHEGGRQLPDV